MKKNFKLMLILVVSIILLVLFGQVVFASDYYTDEYGNACACPQDVIRVDNLENMFSTINSSYTRIDNLEIPENSSFSISENSTDVIEKISNITTFSLVGKIIIENIEYNINDYYDFSSTSRFHIANWAFRAGILTESEKIEAYHRIIENRCFYNVSCLNSFVHEIEEYEKNNNLTGQVNTGDVSVLSNALENSYNSNYESTNFIVYYNSGTFTQTTAQTVANLFEEAKIYFTNAGFDTNLRTHDSFDIFPVGSKYVVSLSSAPNTLGLTRCVITNGVVASRTVVYNSAVNYSSEALRSTVYHEYFHAIQNGYNYQESWFKEATATLMGFINNGTLIVSQDEINAFVMNNEPINFYFGENNGYGAVLFPLTIYKEFGGINAILEIYEAYANVGTNITFDQFRNVITTGISNAGYSGSFDMVYRKMASYLYKPSVWYNEVDINIGQSRANDNIVEFECTNLGFLHTTTCDIDEMTSKYFTLDFPENLPANTFIYIDIKFNSESGKSQFYTVSDSSQHSVTYTPELMSDTTYLQGGIGTTYTTFGIILSNLNSSYQISCEMTITLLKQTDTAVMSDDSEYFERSSYLNLGDVAEYHISFESAGKKIIQTFSQQDTIIELYTATGSLIESNDNDGYDENAFINYYINADTEIVIKVRMKSSTDRGYVKLSIISDSGYPGLPFEIISYDHMLGVYADNSQQNVSFDASVDAYLISFVPTTGGNYTISYTGTDESKIYIIDPRGALPIDRVNILECTSGQTKNIDIYMQANTFCLIIIENQSQSSSGTIQFSIDT